jgi:dihydrofolate reductase
MSNLISIWAQDKRGGIAKGGEIPWHLAEDFAFFKEMTVGKTVLLGRRTWESLPRKPLPGRRNFVLTTKWREMSGGAAGEVAADGAKAAAGGGGIAAAGGGGKAGEVAADGGGKASGAGCGGEAGEVAAGDDGEAGGVRFAADFDLNEPDCGDVYIIGGRKLYKDFMGRVNAIYVTEIDYDFSCDLFAPKISNDYELISSSEWREANADKTPDGEAIRYRFLEYSLR